MPYSYSAKRNARRQAAKRAMRINSVGDWLAVAVLSASILCGGIATIEAAIEVDAQNGLSVSQSLASWGL